MDDRNVQYPQRYQLKKVEGTDDIFDIIPAPGEIDKEGTLINKAALLKDETAALFKGLPENPVPDEVLQILSKAALLGEGELVLPNGDLVPQVNTVYGTYTGKGTSGKANKNKIVFSGPPPDIIFISAIGNSEMGYSVKGSGVLTVTSSGYEADNAVTWGSNYISWYFGVSSSNQAIRQLNRSGQKYSYTGIIIK